MTDRALITKCLATFPCRALESVHSGTSRDQSSAKELSFRKINLSITLEKYWMEKVVPTLAYFVTMFVTYTSSIFYIVQHLSVGPQALFTFDHQGICYQCAIKLGCSPPNHFLCKFLIYEHAKGSKSSRHVLF